jgi:prepilin-type N-terminal cleavage/methylation domain-containing protein
MPPRNNGARGFSLIEAVIVIAIMAILASAATPMLMRALQQQRTRQTQELARTAYEALVGARDRSVPNLARDVGFVPPAATMNDLRILTTRGPAGWPAPGTVPLQYPTATGGFIWGWNGPYWTSPIQNGLPTDAFGRPFRWSNYQVQSRGADGQFNTADDVVYPPTSTTPVPPPQLIVNVTRSLSPPIDTTTLTVQVLITYLSQQQVQSGVNIGPLTFNGEGSKSTVQRPIPPGMVLIQVINGADIQSQTITLAPGETIRVVPFRTSL